MGLVSVLGATTRYCAITQYLGLMVRTAVILIPLHKQKLGLRGHYRATRFVPKCTGDKRHGRPSHFHMLVRLWPGRVKCRDVK